MKPYIKHSILLGSAVALAAACGGSSSNSNSTSSGGSSGSGADGGSGGESVGGSGVGASGGDGGTSGVGMGTGGGPDTGGASGSTGSGGDPTGGTGGSGAGGTAGTSGSGAGGTGGMEPEGEVGTLGGDCDPPGALACAGHHQKLTLVCGASGKWEVNQTCGADEFCDSTTGVNAGTCRGVHPDCTSREPGEAYCSGEGDARRCGVDSVTSELVEDCNGICDMGTCDNSKDPCPEGDFANCADDCGGRTTSCTVGTRSCDTYVFSDLALGDTTVVRSPGYSNACTAVCDSGLHIVMLGPSPGGMYRVNVQGPWMFADEFVDMSQPFTDPCDLEWTSGCFVTPPGPGGTVRRIAYLGTYDESAGPRNLTIERVDGSAQCP